MLKVFFEILKISLSTYGGGSTMISLFQKEFVETGLINSKDFSNIIAMSQATPGPIASGVATAIGYKLFGVWGIIISNIAIIIPTIAFILIFSAILKKYKDSNYVVNVFGFLKPVIVALMLSVIIYFIDTTILINPPKNGLGLSNINYISLGILLFCILINQRFKDKPLAILLLSAILGGILL